MFIPPLLAYFLMLVGVLALAHVVYRTRPDAVIKWLQEKRLMRSASVYLFVVTIALLWRPDQDKSAGLSLLESDERQAELLMTEKPLPASVLQFKPDEKESLWLERNGYYEDGYEETFGEIYDLDAPETYDSPYYYGGVLMESFGWVA